MLPIVDIRLHRLLIGQPLGVSLGSQRGRFIGGCKTTFEHACLQAVDFVREADHGLIDADRFLRHDEREIGIADGGRKVAAGLPKRHLGIMHGHFRRRCGQAEFAPGLDNLVDAHAIAAGRSAIVRWLHLVTERRIGIGVGLNHVAAGRLDVGGRLSQGGAVGRGHLLEVGQRIGPPEHAHHRLRLVG